MNHIQNIIGKALPLLAITVVAFLFITIVAHGLERNDRHQCLVKQERATEFVDYYITESWAQTCDALNIEIDAPVRDSKGNVVN